MTNFFLVLISIFMLSTAGSVAHAASFSFGQMDGERTMPVRAGDIILIPLFIEPTGEQVSIVGTQINFPRELLWIKSFTFANGWVRVEGEEYNSIDNGKGVIVKTAGFEDGLTEHALFGTIEFIAIKEGVADITLGEESFIFNSRNQNLLSGDDKHTTVAIARREADPSAPAELFDIRLSLEKATLQNSKELIARVTFQSFGRVPTPVDMEFLITDHSGKILASFEDSVVVETEANFTKQFEALDLPYGDYALHLNTRYAASVMDSFSAEFQIIRPWNIWWTLGAAMIFAACIGLAVSASGAGKLSKN